jgi:hypothetical protein
MPVYLIVADRLDEAVLALVWIGVDRIDGYATPATLDALARMNSLAPFHLFSRSIEY